MQGKLNIDKLLKVSVTQDGDRTVLTAQVSGSESKSTPLTPPERRQILYIIQRTGIAVLDDAEDLISENELLTNTIRDQQTALEGVRNELQAATGLATQYRGTLSTLEAKTAELEKQLRESGEGEQTITQLREIIAGLQAKVNDLTQKLQVATTPEPVLEATVANIEDDSSPDTEDDSSPDSRPDQGSDYDTPELKPAPTAVEASAGDVQ